MMVLHKSKTREIEVMVRGIKMVERAAEILKQNPEEKFTAREIAERVLKSTQMNAARNPKHARVMKHCYSNSLVKLERGKDA